MALRSIYHTDKDGMRFMRCTVLLETDQSFTCPGVVPNMPGTKWNANLQTLEELGQTASLGAAFGHGLEVAVELRHHHIVPHHGFLRRVHQLELETTDDVGNGHVHFHVREARHRSSLAECQSRELLIYSV